MILCGTGFAAADSPVATPEAFEGASLRAGQPLQLKLKQDRLGKLRASGERALESSADSKESWQSVKLKSGDAKARGDIAIDIAARRRQPMDRQRHLTNPPNSPNPSLGKLPLRIELDKDRPLFGIRKLRLYPLELADYQAQALVLSHLRREGVLVPRRAYLPVSLNGEALAAMALEEDLAKELIEGQQRRYGPLLRFAPFGTDGGDASSNALAARAPRPDDRLLHLRPLLSSGEMKDEAMKDGFDMAQGLVRGFVQRQLAGREVFDLDLMGRFFAVAELWHDAGLLRLENIRFYFNPVSQRLEPVAFSPRPSLSSESALSATAESQWAIGLLADPELRVHYTRHLQRISGALGSAENTRWLSQAAERRVAQLKQLGITAEVPTLDGLHARSARTAARAAAASQAAALADRTPFANPSESPLPAPKTNPIPSVSLSQALAAHAFLKWLPDQNSLQVKPGFWNVRGSLVLPEGVGLRIGEATTLHFEEEALLMATGPLRFLGSPEQPVVLEGRVNELGPRSWQGIVVLRSAEPHHWKHVVIRRTSGIDRGSWKLTGGVTIRQSELLIEDSTLQHNLAEDALNLIRSSFTLQSLDILDTPSDAFDADFCRGKVLGGRYEAVGGDGIDVSGSQIEVSGVQLSGVRDKAISVGERSTLRARGVVVRSVGTALASKDASLAVLEESELEAVRHPALMAYVKKSEYGPAEIDARKLKTRDVARLSLAQTGSRIRIDGVEQSPEALDTKALYSRGFMKK